MQTRQLRHVTSSQQFLRTCLVPPRSSKAGRLLGSGCSPARGLHRGAPDARTPGRPWVRLWRPQVPESGSACRRPQVELFPFADAPRAGRGFPSLKLPTSGRDPFPIPWGLRCFQHNFRGSSPLIHFAFSSLLSHNLRHAFPH